MKYGAPKAEMFAVVTFVEKYRAYLGSAPFKLRVDNRALSWLKTYSMDQSYIRRWIVRLDGYHIIIEHRMRDKYQNADNFSKKTEFYERLEQKQANQAEIKEGFSFLDKETYEALPLTRWLEKSGHSIPGHPELPVELIYSPQGHGNFEGSIMSYSSNISIFARHASDLCGVIRPAPSLWGTAPSSSSISCSTKLQQPISALCCENTSAFRSKTSRSNSKSP